MGVLAKKFDYESYFLTKIDSIIRNRFKVIVPDIIPDVIKTDPADNQVLAVAAKERVNFTITGDNHLLSLDKFKDIPVITSHQFLAELRMY